MSTNRNYFVRINADGNLIVNVSAHFVPANVIWATGTTSAFNDAPFKLYLQLDCNLVLSDKYDTPLWASDTVNAGTTD